MRVGAEPLSVLASERVMLKELVDIQEKEVELAVVGKGEYTLHPAYEGMRVTASKWVKMTYDQQQAALRKIHSLARMCQPLRRQFLR